MSPGLLMSLSAAMTTGLVRDAAGIPIGLRDAQPVRQIRGADTGKPVLVSSPAMPAAWPRSLKSTSSAMTWTGAGGPSMFGAAARDDQTTALSRSGSVFGTPGIP